MMRLCELVEQVLASNRDMSQQLQNMDNKPVHTPHSPGSGPEDDASISSSRTVTPPLPPGFPRILCQRMFNEVGSVSHSKEDLFPSRVYRKALFNDSHLSFVTSAATNKTFYPIPENGSPVTIPIMKGRAPRSRDKESTITQSSKAPQK